MKHCHDDLKHINDALESFCLGENMSYYHPWHIMQVQSDSVRMRI